MTPHQSNTLIGQTMRIQGSVKSSDEIVLNGELQGQVETTSRFTVGSTGKADATVKAKEVIVAGSVKGNVDASDRLTVRTGANLVGDVKTAGIVIEDGAYFKGGIDIARPTSS